MKRSMMAIALAIVLLLLTGYQVRTADARQAEQVVTMGSNTFGQTSITIKQGQTIIFVDEKTGAEHVLVIGKQGMAQPETGAPDFKGSRGIIFQPGQSWTSPPWSTAGTYHVTCTVHPTTMNLTVTVTP